MIEPIKKEGLRMPKTHNHLFDRIAAFDNLWLAYLSARKGKRFRNEVAIFSAKLEVNLTKIHKELLSGTWRPGAARTFVSLEPKRRVITAPPFADRIVHHALYRVVMPLFDKKFIHHSYACRIGKGAQAAITALQQFLREVQSKNARPYVMQADVKNYFATISHEVLLRTISRTVRCKKTLDLWQIIIQGYEFRNIGRPIGALTSQLEANIMLDQLDHYMTDIRGYKYLRYMDDFLVIAPDKETAQQSLLESRSFVEGIGLKLNPKTRVYPIGSGVDWCGYRTWPTHILPRKRNVKRAKIRLKKASRDFADKRINDKELARKIASFKAYMKHCSSKRTVESVFLNILQDTTKKGYL
jgi:retron-type reverse transcriptase